MRKLFNDLEDELQEIKNLFNTLDNAMIYCSDTGADSYHLHTLSSYAYKRLNKFVNDFENLEYEYYRKYVTADDFPDYNPTVDNE